jgi:hypothetical protein
MRPRPVCSLSAVAAVLTLAVAVAPAAVADPAASPQSSAQTITCDGGAVFHTAGAGHGLFSPAHDLDSTAMLMPVHYGEIVSTFVGADGSVEVDTVPGDSKGPGALGAAEAVRCDYVSSFDVPGGTVIVTGEMDAVITPRVGERG